MESLSGTYARNATVQDRLDLDQWLAQPTEPAAPPKPEPPKPPEKPSALAKGVQATGESIATGFDKIRGVLSQGSKHGVGPGAVAKEIMDGLIGIVTSPVAGVGAGSQQAFENLSPETAKKVILPGGPGGTAKLVRAMLGTAAFSPKQTPEERAGNEAPMTLGELANVATSLATLIYGPKAIKGASKAAKGALGGDTTPPPSEVPKIPEPAERMPESPLAVAAGETQAGAKMLPESGTGGVRVGEPGEAVPTPKSMGPGEVINMAEIGGETAGPSALEAGAKRYGMAPHEYIAEVLHGVEADFAEIIKGAGGDYKGMQDTPSGKRYTVFNEPQSGSTIYLPEAETTAGSVASALKRKRGEFGLEGESGKADPALLARIGVGAAIGCATADDAEGCAKRALLGAGIAAPLSAKLATAVAARIKGVPGTVAEAADKAAQRSKVAVQGSEQAFQPNYQRLDMTPAVKNLMVNVHRSIKEDILARRGPAKTNDATVTEALRRIETGKFTPERVLTLGDEEMLNREDLTAARILTKRSFEHTLETRDRILKGEVIPEGSYKQQVALSGAMGRNTRVAQTRIAQSQQASAIKIGNERVSYRPEDVAHLADTIEPGMTDQQLAMLHSTVKSPEQVGKIATFMSVFPRAGLQAMYFSYLSGKAVLRNLVGNTTMMGLDVMDTGIGRFMPTWDKKPRILPGEATQRAIALGEALVDHVRMIRHLDMIDADAVRLGFGNTVKKSEMRQPAMKDAALSLGAEEGGKLARLGDWADKVTTFPGEVLDKTDMASKAINGRMEITSQGMYQATREGLTGEAFWNRVGELKDDPTLLTQSARERIIEVGEQQTFTQEFEGRILKALAAGPENQWLNLVYRGSVMPFFRVTARMTERGMARTPGLHLLAKEFWTEWDAGGVRRQKAEARVVGGAAIIGSFMYLESQGVITGNAPKDPKLRAIWDKAGYQQRSWWDPVSEKWRSYDGLGPLTTMVSTAADTSMTARKLPESDMAHLVGTYLFSTLHNLDSRTFTQSVSNLMDVIKNPSNDSATEKGLDFLRKQVAGWAKPGVVRELETLADPAVRRPVRSGAYDEDSLTGSLGREYQMLLDDIRAGWAGFSDAKDAEGNFLVPPDRDPITGAVTIVESWPFNPFPGRAPKPLPFTKPENAPATAAGDIRQELLRLNSAGLEPLPDWIGGSNPGAGAGFSAGNLREGIRLTGQAKDRWVVLMTQVVRDDYGHTYQEALKAQMEDPFYWAQSDGSRGTDGGKAIMLQAIEREFRLRATKALYGEAPGIERKVLERQGERAIQTVPTAQQPDIRDTLQNLIKSLGR